MSLATARNIAIVLVLAALVALIPGGGTGATVAIQAVSLVFVATLGWFASVMYRQHRSTLYSLGDRRRVVLYVALGVAAVTLTGTTRLWSTPGGSVAWLLLIGGAVYTVFAIFWAARRY
jgi:predicted membrane channel-forming protein YqfA (hemolysin III family)